jgi:hypothetical protein
MTVKHIQPPPPPPPPPPQSEGLHAIGATRHCCARAGDGDLLAAGGGGGGGGVDSKREKISTSNERLNRRTAVLETLRTEHIFIRVRRGCDGNKFSPPSIRLCFV